MMITIQKFGQGIEVNYKNNPLLWLGEEGVYRHYRGQTSSTEQLQLDEGRIEGEE